MSMLGRARWAAAALGVAAAALVATALPATAITDGEPDGDAHPYVGLMVAQTKAGDPLWRCTGTLISPKLFLTAGHCTEAPAEHVEIWFGADLRDAEANNYPNAGDASGTPFTHPEYDPAAFYTHDLGVVVLKSPVRMRTYGALPALDVLDRLSARDPKLSFTAVGYGLQASFPDAASWKDEAERIRLVAHPELIKINTPSTGDGWMILTNNANTGGTCSGDSGGPNFIGTSNVIGGVTSFGVNPTCAGTGGVYRVDRSDDLTWLATFTSTTRRK
jgi:secreted trypsin-like serine protease